MDDRLSLMQILLLVVYAAAMAGGQILFKLAALRSPAFGSLGERLLAMAQNKYFAAAVALYAALTILPVRGYEVSRRCRVPTCSLHLRLPSRRSPAALYLGNQLPFASWSVSPLSLSVLCSLRVGHAS